MDKNSYEQRIQELEAEIKIMKERYQILVETTSAILFEYKPAEDKMIFNYNFPENKSRREIENYHEAFSFGSSGPPEEIYGCFRHGIQDVNTRRIRISE